MGWGWFRNAPGHDDGATERGDVADALVAAVEGVVTDVPAPHTSAVGDPAVEAERIARQAAHRAALLSGSLALPPGPVGLLTILPDLYLIWRVQRQMVADIFSLHGRSAELTPTHMAYCLFRHLASHLLKDAAVRAGERLVVRELSRGALQSALSTVGGRLAHRVVGSAASRWLPVAGAAAVAAYAYWDTLQVAKAAYRLLGRDAVAITSLPALETAPPGTGP
jgi:uncharacterized protein (DUF697 family)